MSEPVDEMREALLKADAELLSRFVLSTFTPQEFREGWLWSLEKLGRDEIAEELDLAIEAALNVMVETPMDQEELADAWIRKAEGQQEKFGFTREILALLEQAEIHCDDPEEGAVILEAVERLKAHCKAKDG